MINLEKKKKKFKFELFISSIIITLHYHLLLALLCLTYWSFQSATIDLIRHLKNHFHFLAIHSVNLNNLCLCTLCNYREEYKPKNGNEVKWSGKRKIYWQSFKNNTCVIRHASARNTTSSSCILINTSNFLVSFFFFFFITLAINYKAIGYSSYVINFYFSDSDM